MIIQGDGGPVISQGKREASGNHAGILIWTPSIQGYEKIDIFVQPQDFDILSSSTRYLIEKFSPFYSSQALFLIMGREGRPLRNCKRQDTGDRSPRKSL